MASRALTHPAWWMVLLAQSHAAAARHQMRPALQGFTQREGVEYNKIFSPTCSLTILRIMAALVCHFDLEWVNYDFEAAFLQSLMSESGDFKLRVSWLILVAHIGQSVHMFTSFLVLQSTGTRSTS